MASYRISELARLAGTTTRNIRAYRERGLLPPPHLTGRTGWYDDAHLARLRLVTRLLQRGYTLGNIAELLVAWEGDRPVREVLGIEQVLTRPLDADEPVLVSLEQLAAMMRLPAAEVPLTQLTELGLAEVDGNAVVLPRPGLVRLGGRLIADGMPADTVLDLAGGLLATLDVLAEHFVQTATATFFPAHDVPATVAEVDERAGTLLAIAVEAVTSAMGWSLERQLAAQLGRSVTQRATTREAVLA